MSLDVAPELTDGQLVDQIVSGHYVMSFDELGHRRRRKRRRVVLGAAIGVAASGGIAVAALNLRSEPRYPEAGVACRADFKQGSTAAVRRLQGDPIEQCAAVWRSGALGPDPLTGVDGAVPHLIMCVGQGGVLEVFPAANEQTCGELGLVEGIVPTAVDPVVQLEDQIRDKVNGECLSRDEARQEITKIIDGLRLSDWRIEESAGDGPCFRGDPVRDESAVHIVPGPQFP